MVRIRASALEGELSTLEQLDKKRQLQVAHLEKHNGQLRNEIQILKNELDFREFQRKNAEHLNYASQKSLQRTQNGSSAEKQHYYLKDNSGKKTSLTRNPTHSTNLIRNFSYQLRNIE